MKRFLLAGIVLFGTSCASIPKKANSIKSFDYNRYLGKWYEIARFDFVFERNLNNTTAEYSLNKDGSIRVENSGYNYIKHKWEKAVGKAKFRGLSSVAELEVSFFGPFYSAYNVIMIDEEYKYALVAGKNFNYLWILSRYTTIPEDIKNNFLNEANRIGYDTNNLIWVEQK